MNNFFIRKNIIFKFQFYFYWISNFSIHFLLIPLRIILLSMLQMNNCINSTIGGYPTGSSSIYLHLEKLFFLTISLPLLLRQIPIANLNDTINRMINYHMLKFMNNSILCIINIFWLFIKRSLSFYIIYYKMNILRFYRK